MGAPDDPVQADPVQADRVQADRVQADPVQVIVGQWQRARPDLDATPLLVLGRIERIADRCALLLRPPFAAAGLAAGDFDVLAALRRADPGALSPGELARAMLVTAGAATKRIDRLAAAGLVTQARAEQDGRRRLVGLTSRGRQLADRLIGGHLAAEAEILGGLQPADRARLGELLGQLLRLVEPAG